MTDSRRFHSDTRVSENFSKDGLETLTGQGSRKWGRYVVKELVDNALEAAEGASHNDPAVSVFVDVSGQGRRAYLTRVTVTDNGPGFDRETLERVADVTEFGGTKRHYALPTRGTQGNALMTILGIQHLADGGPLRISSRGRLYEFGVDADTIDGVPNITINEQSAEVDHAVADGGVSGTSVTVEFGDDAGQRWAKSGPIMRTLFGFAALNPHVDLTISGYDSAGTESGGVEDTSERYAPSAPSGSVHWFDRSAFEERLKADMRAAPELTVEEFVGEFDGLSSRQKRQAVTAELNTDADATLREAYSGDGVLSDDTDELHAVMQAETRKRSAENLDSTLGRVGDALRDGTKAYLDHYDLADVDELATALKNNGEDVDGWRDLTLYYRTCDAEETDEHRLPFVFELAAVPVPPNANHGSIHNFGINRSVAYSTPRVSLSFNDTNGDRSNRGITNAFSDEAHDFIVVSNLICPNIPFKDKGKQSFPTEPFSDAVSEIVGKTIRKYQLDLRPMLNRLEKDDDPDEPEVPNKAHHGFIRESVNELFEESYNAVSGGGEYTVTMRQLFYDLRPRFQERAERFGYKYKNDAEFPNPEKLELKYDTFTGYVDDYEQDVLGGRVVHRNKRGFFVEPHSNREIELSTKKVEQYDPADAVDVEFNTLLFIEKRGFYELIHKDFELTKRYDIGLVLGQGYSTIAARDLVEKIKQVNPDVELLTLTDLDVNGLGIAVDADDPDEFSAVESFGAERIGVTLEDVRELDLATESADYNDPTMTQLENQAKRGMVDPETHDFLRKDGGQRVEINAIPPKKVGEYIETKLEERAVDKITPDPADVDTPDVDSWDETRDQEVHTAIGEFIDDQLDDDLVETLANADERIGVPDESDRPAVDDDETSVCHAVREALADRPPKSWKEVNQDVVDELKSEVEQAQREFAGDVRDAVHELIQKDGFVEVSPPDIDG